MHSPHSTSPRSRGGADSVWPGGIRWIGIAGESGALAAHSHHALQLSFGDDRPLSFRGGNDAEFADYPSCLIPVNLPHALDTADRRSAIVFVDPETPEGRALQARATPGRISALSEPEHSLTQAALDAGFADAAHTTRTFRRMVGFAPSMMKWV